jgi:hypothetical protein
MFIPRLIPRKPRGKGAGVEDTAWAKRFAGAGARSTITDNAKVKIIAGRIISPIIGGFQDLFGRHHSKAP